MTSWPMKHWKSGRPRAGSTGCTAWSSVREELLAMAAQDLQVRSELAADGSLFHGYHPRMRGVHDANASRLAAILDARGWPGEHQVGPDGAEAAWLIAQHAIAQPTFQRHALKLLRTAVDRGHAPARQAAMLEDRIRIFEGRPQLYGTQVDSDPTGQLNPLPIEDPDHVDSRRREVGLGSLEQQLLEQRLASAREGERPVQDWTLHQRELDAWCRDVGWRP